MIKLNPYPWIFALAACGCLYVAHKGIVKYEVAQAVKTTQVKMRAEHQQELLIAASQSRKVEQTLEASHISLENIKDKQIETLNTKLAIASSELLKRPTRPATTNSTKAPNPPEACTGVSLYREDGEFLIREAARADQVVVERNYYYAEYENARKIINEYSNSH